ncbi:MAG: hypothetical protein EOM12_15020 [Verrucomicrobiae bacterium]|nr:hypothetical protein [Verrucomicrobiae bacterium]
MIYMDRVKEAVQILVAMGASKVVLFGSAVEDPQSAHDIDLAVSGIASEKMLDADVCVGDVLQQPYDLIRAEDNAGFFEIISRYGKVLHG